MCCEQLTTQRELRAQLEAQAEELDQPKWPFIRDMRFKTHVSHKWPFLTILIQNGRFLGILGQNWSFCLARGQGLFWPKMVEKGTVRPVSEPKNN